MIGILIPVLSRPPNAQRVIDSISNGTTVEHTVLFLCTPDDDAEIVACEHTGADVHVVEWPAGPGDWARKINVGLDLTEDPYLLLGADDLRFHPGWDEAVLHVAETSGCGVIGTNDLGNATVMRGLHSTHPLVRRTYAEEQGTIDEPGKILHEGYHHQWVDNELVTTAQMRGEWAFARHSHVEHLHPFWHKSEMDATYRKALSTSREDHRLFHQRKRLIDLEIRRRVSHG
jgi:glycosyltransferase involved in cell wall biosynthesis